MNTPIIFSDVGSVWRSVFYRDQGRIANVWSGMVWNKAFRMPQLSTNSVAKILIASANFRQFLGSPSRIEKESSRGIPDVGYIQYTDISIQEAMIIPIECLYTP